MVNTVFVTSISPANQNKTYFVYFSHVWWNLWTLHGWQRNESLRNFLSPVACDDCHGQDNTATGQCCAALKHQNIFLSQHGIIVPQNETLKCLIKVKGKGVP
jgi:hypothetical protein